MSFQTPKNNEPKRRLGLSKSSTKRKSIDSPASNEPFQRNNINGPTTGVKDQPSSASAINTSAEAHIPKLPNVTLTSSNTCNSKRKYSRLSLAYSSLRNKKKKLDFTDSVKQSQSPYEHKEEHEPPPPLNRPLDCSSKDTATPADPEKLTTLRQIIKQKEQRLKYLKDHQAKVEELKSSIAQWRTALKKAIEELSIQSQPHVDIEDLIKMFNIKEDMITLSD